MMPSEQYWARLPLAVSSLVLTLVLVWLKGKSHARQRRIGPALYAGIDAYALFLVVFGAG